MRLQKRTLRMPGAKVKIFAPMMHLFIFVFILFAYFLCVSQAQPLAPLLEPKGSRPIKNRYIIVLRRNILGIQSIQQQMHIWLEGKISAYPRSSIIHHYESIGAYAVHAEPALLDEIRQRAEVDYVEKDTLVHIWDQIRKSHLIPMGRHKKDVEKKRNTIGVLIQANAPWGLSRISKQRRQARFSANSYTYPKNAGLGVDVYVIDTGIYVKHTEFEGRARWGITIPKKDFDIDANGHGTHCAGIIAGKTFGVAKQANVIAVKVLRSNGFGTNSDVIKGIEWVIKQHRNFVISERKSIINMSLGGSRSFALDLISQHAIKLGIPLTVAAGNDFEDACNFSPASVSDAITVGAMDQLDSMAFFSNFGKCVDLFAPGVGILSSWIGKSNAVQLLSGTSMATPHVAGVMALYLSENGKLTAEELKSIILKNGITGILKSIPFNTPNNLLSILSLLQNQKSNKPVAQ